METATVTLAPAPEAEPEAATITIESPATEPEMAAATIAAVQTGASIAQEAHRTAAAENQNQAPSIELMIQSQQAQTQTQLAELREMISNLGATVATLQADQEPDEPTSGAEVVLLDEPEAADDLPNDQPAPKRTSGLAAAVRRLLHSK